MPDKYEVYLYPNDFAAFRPDSEPFNPEPGLFARTGARGVTDVVLYDSDHNILPSQMPVERWRKVIEVWTSRSRELDSHPDIAYVHIFENTGVAIGVTMPHPHGQIYGFPFVPPLVQRELSSAADYFRSNGACLYCRILEGEIGEGRRVIACNRGFVAFAPFFARWPAEVHIGALRHYGSLADLTAAETCELAALIKLIRMKYDNLYGFPMPLMMILRQSPAKEAHSYDHFRIDFYPIQRSATKLKYLAGVESGAGTFLNDTVAEEKARELRETEPRSL